jgi:hypothetical protein
VEWDGERRKLVWGEVNRHQGWAEDKDLKLQAAWVSLSNKVCHLKVPDVAWQHRAQADLQTAHRGQEVSMHFHQGRPSKELVRLFFQFLASHWTSYSSVKGRPFPSLSCNASKRSTCSGSTLKASTEPLAQRITSWN